MRKKIFIIFLSGFIISYFIHENVFFSNFLPDAIIKYTILFFMPTGFNYYTGPLIALFLALDLAFDFLPLKFEIVTLSLRMILRGALLILIIMHILLVVGMGYFMQKGGF